MKNTYFSIDATLKQLLRRMQEYAQMTLPSEFEHMRLDPKPPLPIWPGDGVAWSGTVYAVSTVEDDVPFFEMAAQEVDGTCRVRIRCLDPKAAKWVRDMIVWLAPGRASGYVQPLPDLPSRRTVPEPTTTATSETNLPSLHASAHDETAQLPEPPQTLPPSTESTHSRASKPGPKGHTIEEQDEACEKYLDGQPDLKQWMIANDCSISVRQFQRWLKSHTERHPDVVRRSGRQVVE